MARCGCSGNTCSCVIIEGNNVTISGTGQAGNPYVINADGNATTVEDTDTVDLEITGLGTSVNPYVITGVVKVDPAAGNVIVVTPNGIRVDCETIADECGIQNYTFNDTNSVDLTEVGGAVTADVILDPDGLINETADGLSLTCADVRTCFTGVNGVTYNPATGQISADISEDSGNAISLQPNGLYVPQGTLVSAGCGLAGLGSVDDPLRVVGSGDWTFGCPQSAENGSGIFCDPDTGELFGPPPKTSVVLSNTGGTTPGVTNVPGTNTVVDTATLNLVNPSACHPAVALIVWEADVTFQLAANTQVTMDMNSDGMLQIQQIGGTINQLAVQQARGVIQAAIPAGGAVLFSNPIQIRETVGGGSTYNRTQWRVSAIITNV